MWDSARKFQGLKTYLISPVPENECRRFWTVGDDARQIDEAALVYVNVGTALDAYVRNWRRKRMVSVYCS